MMSRSTSIHLVVVLSLLALLCVVVLVLFNTPSNRPKVEQETLRLRLPGNLLATAAINQYLHQCSLYDDSPTGISYAAVESQTRDASGQGWTQDMFRGLLLSRWNAQLPQDVMYSTTVTHLVVRDEPIQITNGFVHTNTTNHHHPTPAINVLQTIDDFHTNNKKATTQHPTTAQNVRGLLCDMHHRDFRTLNNDDNVNIFDVRNYVLTKIKGASNSTQEPPTQTQDLYNWINDQVPSISTTEELAFYGFSKVTNNQSFVINSPIGYYPLIPTFIGRQYHRNIRGGLYIEHHNPIHLWSPTTWEAANSGGFILTAIPVQESWTQGKGWVGSNPLTAPQSGTYKFAKIKIEFGETLVSHPFAYHCDGTLSGGVYLTSFSFGRGPNGASSADAAASGFQPIVSSNAV